MKIGLRNNVDKKYLTHSIKEFADKVSFSGDNSFFNDHITQEFKMVAINWLNNNKSTFNNCYKTIINSNVCKTHLRANRYDKFN